MGTSSVVNARLCPSSPRAPRLQTGTPVHLQHWCPQRGSPHCQSGSRPLWHSQEQHWSKTELGHCRVCPSPPPCHGSDLHPQPWVRGTAPPRRSTALRHLWDSCLMRHGWCLIAVFPITSRLPPSGCRHLGRPGSPFPGAFRPSASLQAPGLCASPSFGSSHSCFGIRISGCLEMKPKLL